jgi:hypothetical protein
VKNPEKIAQQHQREDGRLGLDAGDGLEEPVEQPVVADEKEQDDEEHDQRARDRRRVQRTKTGEREAE